MQGKISGCVPVVNQQPLEVRHATYRIIHGESLRTLAKECQIKEPELRLAVLKCADYLWRIAISQQDTKHVQSPHNIPTLRSEEWQAFVDLEKLSQLVETQLKKYIVPFSDMYGVEILDLHAYQAEILRLQRAINH
ncbi:hypothetical protein QDY68_07175 [Kingella negevensis]|uniref:hypothetical protein n=1 Tax=Kingella negevensis TaxID=1522312 RepID=UPI00117B6F67|nr:hypothetical protein [Kingella negevensis]MDK4692469.1 hypothetical protein [Kingella negevensis]MDK4698770.1 hypothetical protein [Kingella negevensis]MDK4710156.1 hypothetical protein [Kingella negevensis]